MIVRLRVALGALMLLIGAIGGAAAQPSFLPKPTDTLPASEGRTYLDLLQLVVPGIAVNGTTYSGGQPTGIRHVAGWDGGDVKLPPTGGLMLEAVPLRSGGADRMALLADFGETEFTAGFAILALSISRANQSCSTPPMSHPAAGRRS